jgi:putative ABC transport system substrate-binding protein
MRRRDLLGAVSWPLLAGSLDSHAQQSAMPVIGFLSMSYSPERAPPGMLAAFRDGLAQNGYVEGRNVAIVFRWAQGRRESLPAMAADLVAQKVDVIVTTAHAATQVVLPATRTIPIVFTVATDPVEAGLVASFNRPGGNATGITLYTTELGPKRLEIMRDLLANARTIAYLADRSSPAPLIGDTQTAARGMGLDLQVLEVVTAGEIERAFATMAEQRPDALVVGTSPILDSHHEQIIALAAKHRIAAIYRWRQHAVDGGLMSYGASQPEAWRTLGIYTGRILKGASPADLPVQQPAKFELVINMGTAKALGLTIPPSILARADEVIE